MTNFGATFKRARESKGISIEQIAGETRISARFLLAIEAEEFHILPGGIFNRGFIRAYAEKVGLDPDQAFADYERLTPIREISETPTTVTASPQKMDKRLYPLAIGGLILLIAIVYLGMRESSNTTQIASPPPAPPSTPAPAASPSAPPPAPEPATVAPEPEPPRPAPADALRLDVEVKETTWIKVYADGKTVNPGEILEPPHKALTIVMGTSDWGNPSLAFDTIYAEGHRGYIDPPPPYPRQFLDRIEKPETDEVYGIAPAIAIRQRNTARTPRSTVATSTEIYDYLRLLFARAGVTICRKCGSVVQKDTVDQIADVVMQWPADTRFYVLYP